MAWHHFKQPHIRVSHDKVPKLALLTHKSKKDGSVKVQEWSSTSHSRWVEQWSLIFNKITSHLDRKTKHETHIRWPRSLKLTLLRRFYRSLHIRVQSNNSRIPLQIMLKDMHDLWKQKNQKHLFCWNVQTSIKTNQLQNQQLKNSEYLEIKDVKENGTKDEVCSFASGVILQCPKVFTNKK